MSENSELSFTYIMNHPKRIYFLMYSLTCVSFGIIVTCLGPMFPYLAAAENRNETEYSFLFTCRAFGFLFGSILVKYLADKVLLHHFLACGIALMGIFSALFYFISGIYIQGICIFIASLGCSMQDIGVNLGALRAFRGDNVSMWLQMIHGFFGVGGLLGPLAVYLFELKTMTVIGVLSFFLGIYYLYLESPIEDKADEVESPTMHNRPIPQYSVYLIALAFFFTIGQETSFGGWISSYAVLYNFSSKEHATVYSSVYWISITFWRFALAAVQGSSTRKVEILGWVGVINSIISYWITFHVSSESGLWIMAIFYGLCNSSLYALLLTIPEEFGYKLQMNVSVIFVIWASLGEGCLAVGVGKFMNWFSYDWLIFGMLIMDAAIIGIVRMNAKIMSDDSSKENGLPLLHPEKGIELVKFNRISESI